MVTLRVGRGSGARPAFPNRHPLGRHALERQSATVLAMLKRDLVVSTLVASLLGITAVVAACGAPPSSESSESSASAIGGINRCFFYPPMCTPEGHTECNPDAGPGAVPGACPALDAPCEPTGAPCSVDDLPAGATTASCVQAAAFPGQVAPWNCLAN
jgi:hypothetical protein